MKNLKNITTAIIAVVFFATTASGQSVKTATVNKLFIVKYMGNENDYLLFQVEIKTENKNFSLLTIDDKEEGGLYSKNLKAGSHLQTFKIEKKEGQELNFKLLYGKKVYTKTFSTNTSLKIITTVSENDLVVL